MATKTSICLSNGAEMPILGFGTWQATREELIQALDNALEAGYRHIDAAPVYENEDVIGEVLQKWLSSGKIKREDLFIVTKLPPAGNRAGSVEKWIKNSLSNLQLSYLDLYLVHTPFTFVEVEGDLHPKDENGNIKMDTSTDHVAVWQEMEQQVAAGRTKAIGLSNFNIKQINNVMSKSIMPVSSLQIELHVYFQQKELVEFCKHNHIAVTAYSPLGSRGLVKMLGKHEEIPSIMDNPTVLNIAKKHNKSSGQIALKFLVQNGICAIPKSTNPKRICENIDLFNFELDEDDLKELRNLDRGAAGRVCDFSFLRGIEKHPQFPF